MLSNLSMIDLIHDEPLLRLAIERITYVIFYTVIKRTLTLGK